MIEPPELRREQMIALVERIVGPASSSQEKEDLRLMLQYQLPSTDLRELLASSIHTRTAAEIIDIALSNEPPDVPDVERLLAKKASMLDRDELIALVNVVINPKVGDKLIHRCLGKLRDALPRSEISGLIFWSKVERTASETIDEALRMEAEPMIALTYQPKSTEEGG